MLASNNCNNKFEHFSSLAKHVKIEHVINVRFRCPITTRRRFCGTVSTFKSHWTKEHQCTRRVVMQPVSTTGGFRCSLNHCSKAFTTYKELKKHLSMQIDGEEVVECPFNNCKVIYQERTLKTT